MYTALGTMYLGNVVGAGTVATYICFIDAWDPVFDHLEARREGRQEQQG